MWWERAPPKAEVKTALPSAWLLVLGEKEGTLFRPSAVVLWGLMSCPVSWRTLEPRFPEVPCSKCARVCPRKVGRRRPFIVTGTWEPQSRSCLGFISRYCFCYVSRHSFFLVLLCHFWSWYQENSYIMEELSFPKALAAVTCWCHSCWVPCVATLPELVRTMNRNTLKPWWFCPGVSGSSRGGWLWNVIYQFP